MNSDYNLPSYNELFGQLDRRKADEGRSVYSPAAYLVDLLQLIDDNFRSDDSSLEGRRPQIQYLDLNSENTFISIPYLDIVNEVLAGNIHGSVEDVLKAGKYPFGLPFNFDNERVKKFLEYLDVTLEELYKLFSDDADDDVVAREYLKLSQEEYNTAVTVVEVDSLQEYWGGMLSFEGLSGVSATQFLKITGISARELGELLYGNLSQTAEDSHSNSERIKAADFFINRGLGGYVQLDGDGENLIWNGDSQVIPPVWFERVNRLIRFGKKVQIGFVDLDLILRSCCGSLLNQKSVQIIAVVKQIHDKYEIPIDVVCSLFSHVNILGIGDGEEPEDLFNRIFNGRFAGLEKKYILASEFIPAAYGGYTGLSCVGDILSANNKEYRKRLCRGLNIAEKELILIVERFRDRGVWLWGGETEVGLPALSLLFRIAKLSELLDVSSADIFNLLDICGQDASIRNYHNFPVLINYPTEVRDCYQIIAGDNPDDLIWLMQILFAVINWMQGNDFTSGELKQILMGHHDDYSAQQASQEEKIAHLHNLYQQFKSVVFSVELLESNGFTKRSSRILYDVLAADDSTLVSQKDKRILKRDRNSWQKLIYQGLERLDAIAPEDLLVLGVGEKVAGKIFRNLVFHGYVTGEGDLDEGRFAKINNNSQIETDFRDYAPDLFGLIQGLVAEEIESIVGDDGLDDNLDEDEFSESIDVAIFLSDLQGLEGLTDLQREELYDNLIFNGYIDAEGNLLQVRFFAQSHYFDGFEVNANIGRVGEDISRLIAARVGDFEREDLVLRKEIFAGLPLRDDEVDDLMENLQFNEYIDANHVLVNKSAFLDLQVGDFLSALMFYPHRYQIVNGIKEYIGEFKSQFYRLSEDIFIDIGNHLVGEWVYEDIKEEYLEAGRIKAGWESFFKDSENISEFALRSFFSKQDDEAVFNTLAEIVEVYQQYRLTSRVFAEWEFNESEQAELRYLLVEEGFISESGMILEAQLDYFLKIENALTFNIPKFEDYNKDIFFALHAIAKDINTTVLEISQLLHGLVEAQELTIWESLQDGLGIPAATIQVLTQQILQADLNVVETLMVPVLGAVDFHDRVAAEPDNNKFNFAYRRIQQFSRLVAKLGLSAAETRIIFQDQNLADKFPENLVLPDDIDSIDALLESPEGIIYIFKDDKYWTYAADTYNLLDRDGFAAILAAAGYSQPYIDEVTKDNRIACLSNRFANLRKIDAAFASSDRVCIIAEDKLFCKQDGSELWVEVERVWGEVLSNFADPDKIDAAFQDKEGKTYLFVGDQYVRYRGDDYSWVDAGYPLEIAGNWMEEMGLSGEFATIDAGFQGVDDKVYLFNSDRFVCGDSLGEAKAIDRVWGRVRNPFEGGKSIDAAFVDGGYVYLLVDDSLIAYESCIENDGVRVKEGFPIQLTSAYENLPAEFVNGVDAGFKGTDGRIYLFKAGQVVSLHPEDNSVTVTQTKESWGRVNNPILDNGFVNAAFVGLEGKTYIFTGEVYLRYSGEDYSQVDAGFPRTIQDDWGGLDRVDAAFVLDGKTYLFGMDAQERSIYVRYSTNDYTVADEGYPQLVNDNWWNLPFELVREEADFANIDAVFNAEDGKTYLFSGNQFIYFDQQQRWWSQPAAISTYWDSIPFGYVTAAFTGKDGKTYLFSGEDFIRYSGTNYNQRDDRYPNQTNRYWGNIVNHIAKTGKVDAAMVVESTNIVDGTEEIAVHTYLFSGNQYVRYRGTEYDAVEPGYPKYISSLREEPRFENLDFDFSDGIDAGFADRRNLYIFKDDKLYVVADGLYKIYDDGEFVGVDCAAIEAGNLFIQQAGNWSFCSSIEGRTVETTSLLPTVLRGVPDKFKTGLNAILQGVDRNTYLFKQQDCFNVLLDREYPLAEEWGRVKNNIHINGTIDAAFVGVDGKTYLFSGDQFVVYGEDGDSYDEIVGHPQTIASHWGGLTSVTLAVVKEGKTYLFETADANGNARYICYSSNDYSQPDPGFPQIADRDFWQIPDTYNSTSGFREIDAVLFAEDNMFLISKQQYIQYNHTEDQWTYPKPLERIWRGISFDSDRFTHIKAAFQGKDGVTYFFSDEYYVSYANESFSQPIPIPIINTWGIIANNFVNNPAGNQIDAAFVFQDKITYLFSGNQYVRYSTPDYRYVDTGYPKLIAENLRMEPPFHNLPESFEETITAQIATGNRTIINAIASNHHNLYIFIDNQCHVVSQSLTRVHDSEGIGKVKNNIVDHNRIDAAFVSEQGQTFLFSGDQYVRYSGDNYEYVDDGYPQAIATGFAREINLIEIAAPFQYGIDAALRGADGNIYLFKDKQYISSGNPNPQPIQNSWGRINNPFVSEHNNSSDDSDSSSDAPNYISAAFVSPSGHLYVFKGDTYIRYTDINAEFVDGGYPQPIKDNWGNLPVNFEAGIDGGFVFEGKTYLLKQGEYVRYSDATYQWIDSIYPQKFQYRWGNWTDYLLSDIKTITQFKRLQETFQDGEYTLVDFLDSEKRPATEPYVMLAEIFGWDVDEVKWLKRSDGFLSRKNLFEVNFDLELVIKFFEIFTVTNKMGTSPSELYEEVWKNLYPPTQLGVAADALYRFLGLLHG